MLYEFMGLLLFLGTILGYAVFCRDFLKLDFGQSLVFSTSLLISILYIGALNNVLNFTIYSLYIFGNLLLLCLIISNVKNQNLKGLNKVFTSDLLAFLTIIMVVFLISRGFKIYHNWDEFSLWGTLIKEMHLYNGLKTVGSPTSVIDYHTHYAQLSTIFYYFITLILGYSEGNAIFANIALCIIFSSIVLLRSSFVLSVALIISVLAPLSFFPPSSLKSLYLDGTVGVVFASAIAFYLQLEQKEKKLFLLLPILFILPNIKELGYWLAYFVIFFIIIDLLLTKHKINKKLLIPVTVMCLAPLLGRHMWSYYLRSININNFSPFGQIPFSSLIDLVPNFLNIEKLMLLKKMLINISKFFVLPGMVNIYCLIVLSLFTINKFNINLLTRYKNTLIISLIGSILYLALRFTIWIKLTFTVYSPTQVANVSDYERYFASYFIIFAYIAITFIKQSLEQYNTKDFSFIAPYNKENYLSKLIIIGLIAISIISSAKMYKLRKVNYDYLLGRRENIRNFIIKEDDQKGYFYENFDGLMDCYIYNFEKSPYGSMELLNECKKQMLRKEEGLKKFPD